MGTMNPLNSARFLNATETLMPPNGTKLALGVTTETASWKLVEFPC